MASDGNIGLERAFKIIAIFDGEVQANSGALLTIAHRGQPMPAQAATDIQRLLVNKPHGSFCDGLVCEDVVLQPLLVLRDFARSLRCFVACEELLASDLRHSDLVTRILEGLI